MHPQKLRLKQPRLKATKSLQSKTAQYTLAVPHLSSKSPKFPVGYIEIRVFSHATEDIEKVQAATRNTLPEALAADVVFEQSTVTGHFGNPISLIEAKLADRQVLSLALEKIGASISTLDKEALSAEFKARIEKKSLFLRFDKQSAYMGSLKLGSSDPIHFRIHFKNLTPDEIEGICQKAGLLL
jgi:RNA binding exosome subunit